jgi:hypothetical protein
MKTHLAAIALAATIAQPAAAVTFPSLTTIYVGSGAASFANDTATVLHCSNVSGVSANLRFQFLTAQGSVAGVHTTTLAHGQTYTLATKNTLMFLETFTFAPELVLSEGVVNVESTNSAVFCTAKVVTPIVDGADGFTLPLVRVNPHPGTVE